MPNLKRLGLNLTEPKTILASNQIQSLKRLDIYNSKFGSPDTSRTILNTILGHPNLRQLSIIQPTSIVEFPTLDCPVNENLEEIILKANSVIMQPTLSRFPNITRLTLIGCRLNQTLPIIAQLRRLQQLILSVEGLTNFPTEFSQLDQLTYLGLSGNGLTTLPLEITRLPRLEYLVLTYNGLTSLPREISNLSGTLRGLYIMEGNNFSMEELALIQQWLPNTTIR
jgi:Leucine-rich repeat (LRR) protein